MRLDQRPFRVLHRALRLWRECEGDAARLAQRVDEESHALAVELSDRPGVAIDPWTIVTIVMSLWRLWLLFRQWRLDFSPQDESAVMRRPGVWRILKESL